jgi:glucose-6-phosphate dehydrogenase assembly protein OpcA
MPAIGAALRQLWAEEQHDRGVVRACVLNLVVYANDAEGAALATDVVTQLTDSHPCRALVLTSDETADETALRAWLSAHCQLPKPNGQRVCCEQVTLAATGDAVERLPSAVLPLLVPDLPVVLWWMGEPSFGSPLFEQLVDVADRLIVDTRSFQDPTFSLSQLASLVRNHSSRIAVDDLNWARLTPWQEQLAQTFDSTETLPYLERAERVTIRYARPRGSAWADPEQALLFAGWLLNRTGWKQPPALTRVGGGHFRGRLRRAGRDLVIELVPHDLEIPPERTDGSGMLLGVELRAHYNDRPAIFRIERHVEDLDRLTTEIVLGDRQPIPVTRMLGRRNLASLLAEDLSRFDHDYLFEAALDTAAHLSGGTSRLT